MSAKIDSDPKPSYYESKDDSEEKRFHELARSIDQRIYKRDLQLKGGEWPDQPTTLGQNDRSGLFAITDWDTEASRIARAFGVVESCGFYGPRHLKMLLLKDFSQDAYIQQIPLGNELLLNVCYNTAYRLFQLTNTDRTAFTEAMLLWNGDVHARNYQELTAARRFVKALFSLGLLTPEIEENLGITPTHHEKLEWQLEFDSY